jgi:hypothetical protein
VACLAIRVEFMPAEDASSLLYHLHFKGNLHPALVAYRYSTTEALESIMPSIAAARTLNSTFSVPYVPVALFVGGTSGVGEGTAGAFARATKGARYHAVLRTLVTILY